MIRVWKPLRLICLAATICTVAPAQHPRPDIERIRLHPTNPANPAVLDLKLGDTTFLILWTKAGGGEFTITFDSARLPCAEGKVIQSVAGVATCELNPRPCPRGAGGASRVCQFNYHTAAGDPQIAIDEGYNPPPPEERRRKKASEKQKK